MSRTSRVIVPLAAVAMLLAMTGVAFAAPPITTGQLPPNGHYTGGICAQCHGAPAVGTPPPAGHYQNVCTNCHVVNPPPAGGGTTTTPPGGSITGTPSGPTTATPGGSGGSTITAGATLSIPSMAKTVRHGRYFTVSGTVSDPAGRTVLRFFRVYRGHLSAYTTVRARLVSGGDDEDQASATTYTARVRLIRRGRRAVRAYHTAVAGGVTVSPTRYFLVR